MHTVERLFSNLGPSDGSEDLLPKPISSYWAQQAFVVLGDPGSGKTTSFKMAANEEPNSIFATVRDFLVFTEQYSGKTLYLDALDEQRAKTNDGSGVLDKLREKLNQLGCPPFRLSCRAADWYGDLDAQSLNSVVPNGKIKILKLEPLAELDIQSIVTAAQIESKAFIRKAKQRGLYELLENPQTLKLLLEVVQDGQWPKSRSELFEKACHLLLKEINPEHSHAQVHQFQSLELFNAAGYLCAAQLCGGTIGFSLNQVEASNSFPWLSDFPCNQHTLLTLQSAARRRLFRTEGPERVSPIHRTIAEYLAANFLAKRVHEGLPVERIIALITGYDGGTLSDLRGLYAWLTCLCISHTDILINRDPLGVILYGDVGVFPLSKKRYLLKCLDELGHWNPNLLSESWSAQALGALASSDMEQDLRKILIDPAQHPVTVHCVLFALIHGTPLPTLGNCLITIVRDETSPESMRKQALYAFCNVCPNPNSCLKRLLDDIHAERIPDNNRELRGALLNHLYPDPISPKLVVKYLVPRNPNFIGSYTSFLMNGLVEATADQDLPILIDSLIDSGIIKSQFDKVTQGLLVSRLLLKMLIHFGTSVQTSDLYRWLGLAVNKHNHSFLTQDEAANIRNWFNENPSIVRSLFKYWLTTLNTNNIKKASVYFWLRLPKVEPPIGFGQWLLDLASIETDNFIADLLFREAVYLRAFQNRSDAPTLEDFFDFVDQNQKFRGVLETELQCPIPDWRRDEAAREQEYKSELKLRLSSRIQDFNNSADMIRSGSYSDKIINLAQLYFAMFYDVDHTLLPEDRLQSKTNTKIKKAALEGFVAALKNPPIATSVKIGKLHAQSKEFPFGYVILAGMDTLANRSMQEVMRLPDATLESALAFHYANFVEGPPREWVSSLIARHPRIASKALEAFWKPHFELRASRIPGLHDLPNSEMEEIAKPLSLSMLQLYPNCKEDFLKVLLRTGIRRVENSKMLRIVQKTLSKRNGVRGKHRTLWYATAFALNAEEWSEKLIRYIARNSQKASELLDFLFSRWPDEKIFYKPSPKEIGHLLSIAGKVFQPFNPASEDGIGINETNKIAPAYVNELINRLAADPTPEASETFRGLLGNHGLNTWSDTLTAACVDQAKQRREATFQYPSLTNVLETINGGKPANPRDLQALAYDHFHTLAEEIRNGPTDIYKAFWNLNSYGKPTNPQPEEPCRDRILDLIKPRLSPLKVEAEPEGHYAQDKRSDIKILSSPFNLPVEIKRHYHRDLWVAPIKQLQNLYARDPGTEGRGIYLVLWFGDKKEGNPLPTPPSGITLPSTPEELEMALTQVIPESDRELLRILVVDCSKPKPKRA